MPVCPSCTSNAIVEGRLQTSGDDGWVAFFYPKNLKFFSVRRSVSLTNGQLFTACTDCGHVGSQLNPTEPLELLKKSSK
jgi:hypothetical protein